MGLDYEELRKLAEASAVISARRLYPDGPERKEAEVLLVDVYYSEYMKPILGDGWTIPIRYDGVTGGEIVNPHVVAFPPEPKPDFEVMKKTIMGDEFVKTEGRRLTTSEARPDKTDKELNTLVCRAFKKGLSTESVAWVFKIPESEVHRIIREAL